MLIIIVNATIIFNIFLLILLVGDSIFQCQELPALCPNYDNSSLHSAMTLSPLAMMLNFL